MFTHDPLVKSRDLVCPLRDCGKHLQSRSEYIFHERDHEKLILDGYEAFSFDFSVFEKFVHLLLITCSNFAQFGKEDTRIPIFRILQKTLVNEPEPECRSVHRFVSLHSLKNQQAPRKPHNAKRTTHPLIAKPNQTTRIPT